MEQNRTSNGWNEYKRLVLKLLEGNDKRLDVMDDKIDKLTNKIIVLETKAIIYAAVTGLLVAAGVQIAVTFLN